jgi:hypothetical protein
MRAGYLLKASLNSEWVIVLATAILGCERAVFDSLGLCRRDILLGLTTAISIQAFCALILVRTSLNGEFIPTYLTTRDVCRSNEVETREERHLRWLNAA